MTIKKRWPRGTWMTLSNVEALELFMRQKDFTGARLARYAGCSRQFIHQLRTGQKKSMTPKLAANIAEALDVPLEVLFVSSVSSGDDRSVKRLAA
jgi:transcriptional regulator with XRE-family HTH domain